MTRRSVWLVAVAWLTACGGGGTAGASGSGGSAETDSAAAALDTLPRYPLRLVNRGTARVVVTADAGAGPITLDTVAAGDSVRVDLRMRADSAMLTAESPDGAGADTSLRLARDSLVRWEIRFPGP